MGWGSATPLFDGAVDVAIKFLPKPHGIGLPSPLLIRAVVESMYNEIDWEDWDTQEDSKYYDDHLIHVMHDNNELDENYYTWYTAGQPDDWDWDGKPF